MTVLFEVVCMPVAPWRCSPAASHHIRDGNFATFAHMATVLLARHHADPGPRDYRAVLAEETTDDLDSLR